MKAIMPRRTKAERAGLVLSAMSLLAIGGGAIAAAPPSTTLSPEPPTISFNRMPPTHPLNLTVDCSGGRWAHVPSKCFQGAGTDRVPRELSASEYMGAYAASVAAVARYPSPGGLPLPEIPLWWGVRFLALGVFLMYLFDATVGRLYSFIARGV